MPDSEGRAIRSGRRREDIAGPSVIAYTTEDDAHPAVRQAAQAHAREDGCVVVLVAADVAGIFTEPLPNAIDAEGAADRFGDRLGLADLEYLGRAAVASQVAQGRAAGARVAAWLPKDRGLEALATYARDQDAHIIFVPDQLGSGDELKVLLNAGKSSTEPGPVDIEVRVVRSGTK